MTHTLSNLKVKLLLADEPAFVIAGKLGIHPSQLSKYALGQQTISPKHLRALCKYFKCKQVDILGTSEFAEQG